MYEEVDPLPILMVSRLGLFLVTFLCGAIPFSYLVGRCFLGRDIRDVGDGNPGASNVFRAGGGWIGWLALAFDYGKGFFPVLVLLPLVENRGPGVLVVLALGPILGHAFSPFLRCSGGKAVAVTFGVWSALTLWVVPTVMGAVFVLGSVALRLRPDGWTVLLGLFAVVPVLGFGDFPQAYWWVLWGNMAIVTLKHGADLRQSPRLERRTVG